MKNKLHIGKSAFTGKPFYVDLDACSMTWGTIAMKGNGKTTSSAPLDAWVVPYTRESVIVHKSLYYDRRSWWIVAHRWTGYAIFPVFGNRGFAIDSGQAFYCKLDAEQRDRWTDGSSSVDELRRIGVHAMRFVDVKRTLAKNDAVTQGVDYPFALDFKDGTKPN